MRATRPFGFLLFVLCLQGAYASKALDHHKVRPHNVILFVADGLRALMVNPDTAPTMYAFKRDGVWFKNSHSLFPTFTTANASALATGHYLGDTGDFSNTIYSGFPLANANGSTTPFLENDAVLGEMNEHFAGNYLNEESLLAAARAAGYSTAAVGKLGPTAIQDVNARDGEKTIIVDDSTGHPGGIPLSAQMEQALDALHLPKATPARGENGNAGNARMPGTRVANIAQQTYLVDVTTRAILPLFKAAEKPFVLVFWSRDPDGTQHNQGDSLDQLVPGINGPSSLAGIHNADDNLAALLAALEALGLANQTDVVVTSDHGFSTISKQSTTSSAARQSYADVLPGELPPGFLAIDIAHGLNLLLFDLDAKGAIIDPAQGQHPSRGDAGIGTDAAHASIVIAANGGSDLVYLTDPSAVAMAPKIVAGLIAEDYVSGIFADDRLGNIAGTLPLSTINLEGTALTSRPALVVNFATRSTGCKIPTNCGVEIADTGLQQGQGMHGSFSRADTYNFTAAIGPGFRAAWIDPAPVSNVDLAQTLASELKLPLAARGSLQGRVLREAFPGGLRPRWSNSTLASLPDASGLRTILHYQSVGPTRYFDAAGFPGRTLGLQNENAR